MQKVSISLTFKRIAFTFLSIFLVTAITTWILKYFASDNTAMALGLGIGIGAGILIYMKYDGWFSKN